MGDVMGVLSTRESRNEVLMACLRIVMGVIFLAVWSDNLTKGFYSPSGWADFVQHYANTTKVGLFADLLNNVMIPNSWIFAYGQFAMELVVFGLFLTLGLFTPVAGLLAAGFQLSLLVATSGTNEWPGIYIIMFLLLVAIALAQSGRTLGLDALFERRLIARQATGKAKVRTGGDTQFAPGQQVDRFVFSSENDRVVAKGGEPAEEAKPRPWLPVY
jgi:uncharacterized membrane protein YphA (DoxX/SURF4 family)